MIAYAISRYGKKQQLQRMELPEPRPEPQEVRIRIRASSINPVDFKIRDGEMRALLHYRMPLILGNDCSGVVEEVGSAVKRFRVGDAVFTRPQTEKIGTFAEQVCVHEDAVARKPENTSFAEAASLPLVGLTAWQAFHEKAQVGPGTKVFIPAGGGGVGTVAIQIAKHLGAFVATTASAKKLDLVKSLGADQIVNYRTEDFREQVRDCDVVLDTVGGETQKQAWECLKPGGKLISIVGPPTRRFAHELGFPLWVQFACGVLGAPTEWRARRSGHEYLFHIMRPDGAQLGEIARLVESGKIRPVIDRIYPLDHAEEALRYVEAGHATGKVVLRVS